MPEAVFVVSPANVVLHDGQRIMHDQITVYPGGLLIDPRKRTVYSPSGYARVEKR